ncbi:SMC-Scp complex subunit ScpB [Candidatus Woesearchaeota archaeon]|nr:SMC-Scp complex subunit ScpB [Candidatus Woesearchaeota archaeon]
MDPELKKKIESVLFAVGKKMDVAEIAKLVGSRDLEAVKQGLNELKFDYEQSDRSISVQNDGDFWKLGVRDRYTPVISKILTQTELTKSVMETLAVIAYKAPLMQSDVIKIRTNKAYDHLVELEKLGYITRKKKGRTKEISLAQKFFEYFDVPPDRLKDKFRSVTELEEVVAQKEQEYKDRADRITQKIESSKQDDEFQKQQSQEEIRRINEHIEKMPHIEIVDEIQTFKETPLGTSQLEEVKDTLGSLEIVPTSTKPEEGEPEFLEGMEVYERKKKGKRQKKPQEAPSPESERIAKGEESAPVPESEVAPKEEVQEAPSLFGEKPAKEIEEIIDLKIKELLTPKHEEVQESKEPPSEEPESSPESANEVPKSPRSQS